MLDRLVARFPRARAGVRVWILVPALIVAAAAAAAAAGSITYAAADGKDPACYGAAARDPERPCRNPDLRLRVTPTPQQALLQSFSPCRTTERGGLLVVCGFRTGNVDADETVALLGDSHASHWRSALEVAVDGLGVRGVSIARSGCPFTRARTNLPQPFRRQCSRWNTQLLRWFEDHPEVRTVFISQNAGARVIAPPGRGELTAQIDGYTDAWKALPRSVKHIVVLRDVPKNTSLTADCVERAMRRRRRPGPACAVPRGYALRSDRARLAAFRLGAKRVRVLNMTPYFCSRRLCPPVIGGVLVHKDPGHITLEYSRTLGPLVLRQVRRLMAAWTD